MKNGRVLATLTVFAVAAPSLRADEPSAVKELLAQGKRLTGQAETLSKVSPKALTLLRLLQQDLKTLEAQIKEMKPPDYFMYSLRRDRALLAHINTEKPTARDIGKLRRALASIDLKVHNLEKREGKFNLTWAEGLPKEPGPQKDVFTSLSANLDKIKPKLKAFVEFDEHAMPLFDQAGRDIRALNELGDKHVVPAPYLLSLAEDAHLLALASSAKTPPVVAAVYFRESAEDLHVKAESSKSSAGNKKSPFQEVKTRVETKDPDDENKPKKGYEVWYVPKGLANDVRYYRRFKQFSTPSVEGRVPGCYEMWTRKQMKKGEEAEVDVKDDGKGECPVDLWIPKEG